MLRLRARRRENQTEHENLVMSCVSFFFSLSLIRNWQRYIFNICTFYQVFFVVWVLFDILGAMTFSITLKCYGQQDEAYYDMIPVCIIKLLSQKCLP